MKRAAIFLAGTAAIVGLGAVALHRNGTPAPNALVSPAAARPLEAPGPVLPTVVGMNIGGLETYGGEWAFNDLVVTSANVTFADPKGGWKDLQGFVSVDQGGHPINVARGTTLAAVLLGGTVRMETGTFACSIPEGWAANAFGDWKMKGSGQKFTMVIDQPVPKYGVVIMLNAMRDNAALTSMSCMPQGLNATSPFKPAFVSEVRPYKVLRFMDWMRTNNAPKRLWADRPTPAFLTQGGPSGVSVEYMVALANATGADPWFNMPFDAEPSYYENFATYVRDHLDPKLKAYVEFSNEVWNEAFQQGKMATQRGQAAYPSVDAATANDYYYADRVREVMSTWSRVFSGQPKRLVRVLAEQAWAERADRALAHKDTWKSVDVVAIAPYLATDPYTLSGTGAARVNALFQRAPQIVDQSIAQALAAKSVANKYKLPMVTYEAGPSFVGYQKEIADDMLAANRDPRIYDLYTAFLKRWQKEVGGLIVLYNSAATPGPGGQYGHLEYTGQPLSDAPKARAVHDFMEQLKPVS